MRIFVIWDQTIPNLAGDIDAMVPYEQNARPGIANRLGARFATHVAVTFPDTPLPRAVVTGMPLRREIALLDRPGLRPKALAHFGLDPQWPTVLVTGGSLGAARINAAFEASVRALRAAGVQVLHVTGQGKEIEVPAARDGEPPYVVVPYADRMDLAYIPQRSGSSSGILSRAMRTR